MRFLFALGALAIAGLLVGAVLATFWFPAVWIFNTIAKVLS